MVKSINSALVGLAIAAAALQNVSAHQPHLDSLNRRGFAGHHHALDRKSFPNLIGRQGGIGDIITIPGSPTDPTDGPT